MSFLDFLYSVFQKKAVMEIAETLMTQEVRMKVILMKMETKRMKKVKMKIQKVIITTLSVILIKEVFHLMRAIFKATLDESCC